MSSSNLHDSDAWDRGGSRGHSAVTATAPTSPYNTSYTQSTDNTNDCTPSYGYYTPSWSSAKPQTSLQRGPSSQPRPRVTANAVPVHGPPKTAPQSVMRANTTVTTAPAVSAPKYSPTISLPILTATSSVGGSSATHHVSPTFPTAIVAPVAPVQAVKATATTVKEPAAKMPVLSDTTSRSLPESMSAIDSDEEGRDMNLGNLASQTTNVKQAGAARGSVNVDPEIGKQPFPKAPLDGHAPAPQGPSENVTTTQKLSFLRTFLTRKSQRSTNNTTLPMHVSNVVPAVSSNANLGSDERSRGLTGARKDKVSKRPFGLPKKVWIIIAIFIALVVVAAAIGVPVSRASIKRKSKTKSSKSKTKKM